MANTVVMETSQGTPFELIAYEDVLLPGDFAMNLEEKLKDIKDLTYMDGDVTLCSFPKSGTHWVSSLISMLKKNKDSDISIVPSLVEGMPIEKLKSLEQPRLLTTHLKPNRLPIAALDKRCKIVLVLRNPKDVLVSFYHHLKKSATSQNKQTWDEYFLSCMSGKMPYGSYFDYLDAWEKVIKDAKEDKNGLNVEYFYFEDLKINGPENLRRLSKYIDCNKSDLELQEVENACSISNLREKALLIKDKLPPPLKGKDGNSVIFRKGDIGDWKNHFTVAQNEAIDKVIESRLENSMFKFKYEL